ncbi:hypothetical protein T484DRAFT_1900356, partial [Baffinella frigidus]
MSGRKVATAEVRVARWRQRLWVVARERNAGKVVFLDAQLATALDRLAKGPPHLGYLGLAVVADSNAGKVVFLDAQLATALDRLAKGDYDLLKDLKDVRENLARELAVRRNREAEMAELIDQLKRKVLDIGDLETGARQTKVELDEGRKLRKKTEREIEQQRRKEKRLTSELAKAKEESASSRSQMSELRSAIIQARLVTAEKEKEIEALKVAAREMIPIRQEAERARALEKAAREAKDKEVRRGWELENKVVKLEESLATTLADATQLRGLSQEQAASLRTSEAALLGVEYEVQRRVAAVSSAARRREAVRLLQQRKERLKAAADAALIAARAPNAGAKIQLTESAGSGINETTRQRLLTRIAALELEIEILEREQDSGEDALDAGIQKWLQGPSAVLLDEDLGRELPLRVLPYTFDPNAPPPPTTYPPSASSPTSTTSPARSPGASPGASQGLGGWGDPGETPSPPPALGKLQEEEEGAERVERVGVLHRVRPTSARVSSPAGGGG